MSYIAKNGRLYTSGASEALTLLDDKFSVNKSYSKGDSCIYNDYLWKFTSDKPAGEWDSSVVEQCRIMDFVDDVNGRLTQVQSQIVPTESIESGATASKEYSVGDFLVKNGVLYKVTKAIAKNDALTVGTNIVITTVGGELSEKSNSAVVGSMTIFAGSVVPNGYLLCDGQAVSRSEYSKLFEVIGTTWGAGDGSTTFNVPDMREVAPVGVGESTRTEEAHDTYTLGQFKDDQLQNHIHSIAYWATSGGANINGTVGSGLSSKRNTGNNNGRGVTVTRSKRIGVNYIIKY